MGENRDRKTPWLAAEVSVSQGVTKVGYGLVKQDCPLRENPEALGDLACHKQNQTGRRVGGLGNL